MVSENCILKKLNLSGNCFSDRDIEMLTVALEVNMTLIYTLYAKMNLTKIFCFVLKKNRLLKELDLSHNNFGDEGGKFLGSFICN